MNKTSRFIPLITFIGVMFGAILLRTKRLWPLIFIHGFIDFAAKFDELGQPFTVSQPSATDVTSAVAITLIVLPCFILGLLILRKQTYAQLVE